MSARTDDLPPPTAAGRSALAAAETGHAAAEPLADTWDQITSGGEGMTAAAWNSVLRRVVSRVEVSDDALVFVPTVGEPVGLERIVTRAAPP